MFTLQHVAQRLEGTITRTGDWTTTSTIVEQRINGFLQHALFVVHDDLRSPEVEQTLQTVVAVDHTTVEIIEIRSRESATIELHHGSQFGRDHGYNIENHRSRIVDPVATLITTVEGCNDLQTLDRLLLTLRGKWFHALVGIDLSTKLDLLVVEVDASDQGGERSCAHATFEIVRISNVHLAPEHLVFDDLASEQALELVEAASEDVDFHLVAFTNGRQILVDRALAGLDLCVLRLVLLHLSDLGLEVLMDASELEFHFFFELVLLCQHLGFEVREVFVATLLVDPGHEVRSEIDDFLELLCLELFTSLGAHQQVREPRAGSTQVPDVDHGSGQLDVSHTLTTHLRARHLDAAAFADDALETHALVLAAVALPVLGGTEDLLAEQAILFRLQRAVVDGLWLLDLAVRPHTDRVSGGQANADLIKVVYIKHVLSFSQFR